VQRLEDILARKATLLQAVPPRLATGLLPAACPPPASRLPASYALGRAVLTIWRAGDVS
jgi:hypothetical protein